MQCFHVVYTHSPYGRVEGTGWHPHSSIWDRVVLSIQGNVTPECQLVVEQKQAGKIVW